MATRSPTIIEYTLDSLEATARFGVLLGSVCTPGDILCLGGDLGAGKTTLAQALAQGIGIDTAERVNSPTFALLHEYRGVVPIYHMDFYRLFSAEEVRELGLDEYFYAGGIAIIEWFERAQELIPPIALFISLTMLSDSARKVVVRSGDPHWSVRLDLIQPQFCG